MQLPKIRPILLIVVATVLTFLSGNTFADGQKPSPGPDQGKAHTVGVHFSTPAELANMQPAKGAVPTAHKSVIQELLRVSAREQFIVCESGLVGSIRISTGGQTCTFSIYRLGCRGDTIQHVTVEDCVININ